MPLIEPNALATSGTITGPLTIGSGTAQQVYVATTPQLFAVLKGTTGSPDATVQPLAKITRTVSMPRASVTGDGGEQMANLLAVSVGDAANQVQTVGLYGGAINSGTANGGSGSPDSAGVYGVGNILGSGIGTGIGAFFNGRRETNTGKANGSQINVDNQTATAGTYNSAGFSDTTGLYVTASGTAVSGVGITIDKNGQTFTTGIGIPSTNPITATSFRDDGNATTSILINGSHSTAAIAVAASSGGVWVGGTAQLVSPSKLEVQGSASASADPLVFVGNTSGGFTHTLHLRNGSGIAKFGICGGTNSLITGTVSGDLAILNNTGSKSVHLGGSASVLQVTNGNALGFFSVATPVAKQTVTGSKGANAALASLMTALAAYGLVTDSTT